MTRRISLLLLAAAAACSGSSQVEPAAPTRVTSEREELEAARPPSPLRTERTTGFRPGERCGQGPYRLEADGLAARYGERLFVYACGPRSVSGSYRLIAREPGDAPSVSEQTFGFQRDNQACVAGAGEEVAVGGPAAGGSSRPAAGSPVTAGAARGAGPVLLAGGPAVAADCQVRTQVLDTTYLMEGDGVPVGAGTRFAIDIWSDTPNDLAGVVFVIEQQAVRRDMTPERWAVHRQADRAWHQRYLAYIHREVAAGRTTLVDTSVKAPPPPRRAETPPAPPPPRAADVDNRPGRWHWDGRIYLWIDGGWIIRGGR